MGEYVALAESRPEELELLARDILISVTAFFRDHDAFGVLEQAIRELCARKQVGAEIRVWVAGCASGEEAYSVAMLFAEALGPALPQYRVQVFATDIDDDALNVARRGLYPAAAMSEVPADWLERYFEPQMQHYEAGKVLRDMIVFARHNLVNDPPFLRLDLVTCRNVLIYFDAPLQAKVLRTFHFGLNRDGLLFLGRSESASQGEGLYQGVDRRERLYRRAGESDPTPLSLGPTLERAPLRRREQRLERLLGGVAEHIGLTAALCDEQGNIQHTVGRVDRYLQFPVGTTRLAMGDVVIPELRGELLTLLHRSRQTGVSQQGRPRALDGDWFHLAVVPMPHAEPAGQLILFLPDHDPDLPPNEASRSGLAEGTQDLLEDELQATREQLQSLIEQLATAHEEMQALNEEAQASNEELQATNEELESANEELQATNEELLSLNEELSARTLELAALSDEYAHLYDALDFSILVFDRTLTLVRYNAAAASQLGLRAAALRQPVARLRLGELLAPLPDMLARTRDAAEMQDALVRSDDAHYRLTVTPGFDKHGALASLVVSVVDVSTITRAQEALAASERRLATLMEKTSVVFAMKDPTGKYLYANRRFLDFFGIAPEHYIGQTDFTLLPPDAAADIWALDMEALRTREAIVREQAFVSRGERRHLRTVHQTLWDADGQPSAFILEGDDVSAHRRAEEQLRITARVFDQSGEAIVVTDAQGVILTVNRAFCEITGYSAEEAIGRRANLLKSGRHSQDFYAQMWHALRENGFWQGEILNARKGGEIYPEWLTINRIDDEDGATQNFVAVFSDITSIKDSQRKIEYLATHDPLTGLPNRSLFHSHLRHALAQARRKKSRVALLFIDLDNFKTINDTLGHDVGDALLKQAATRLSEVVRDIDTVARLGGDEFTAVLQDANSEIASQVARRIVDDMSSSFDVGGRALFVSASVGVAFYPEDGEDSATLIKAADSAMYRAKELGRQRVEFFAADMQVRLLKRATLESALREGLRAHRLRLVFQPKYSLGPGQPMVGAEALLRWQDPELGDVPPSEFITVAETSGLILDVGRAVIDLLVRQLAAWRELGLQAPRIAFNASPRQIREPDFARHMLASLGAHNVPPSAVGLEITESALVENSQNVRDNLEALHAAGTGIAIDDFGTGYSSLGYLKRMPLSELKIDKSFVDGLGHDREDEAIARAVLALAQALELDTVAEGVETERQLAWLTTHQCSIAQGYLFSRPLEVTEFEDLIARFNAT